MTNSNPKELKKKAITDISNAKNFLVIAIVGSNVNRHLVVDESSCALSILRALKEAETNLLFPQQASNVKQK